MKQDLTQVVANLEVERAKKPVSQVEELQKLQTKFSQSISKILLDTAKEQYGNDLKKPTRRQLEHKTKSITDTVVNQEYGDYSIRSNQLSKEREEAMKQAQASGLDIAEITKINECYDERCKQAYDDMITEIQRKFYNDDIIQKAAETIVETVETEKLNNKKNSIEASARDHLRGFSRTIPAFLMAYGDESTTLQNFDSLVPEDVFWKVTFNPNTKAGVSLDDFRLLRDGGEYTEKDSGEIKYFEGKLFDEAVFNAAVIEFMKRRAELANYFDEDSTGDIFDYIPPQRTNQIFTPKHVVKEMVDLLEIENPGCFDDPKNTFADLYMKSGMYITEIVTRLYQSPRMKVLYPDSVERLNHIFGNQVYGCAPTEIIYRICLRYILGFSDEIKIDKHNIVLCDTLDYAKIGDLHEKLVDVFDF
ncbi:MAG: restriction endonuclease [Eubacteriales bacterium]|nr:restriction endonuclease [Eubacteriales bacterium]